MGAEEAALRQQQFDPHTQHKTSTKKTTDELLLLSLLLLLFFYDLTCDFLKFN
jgi:hypothetical protein